MLLYNDKLLRYFIVIVADNRENFNDYIHKYPGKYVSHGSALHAKMERGDYIGNDAPYGYQKDPNNKNRLLMDQETAPIVRMIFPWRAGGLSDMGINKRLNDMAIPSPSQLKAQRGLETNNNKKNRTSTISPQNRA